MTYRYYATQRPLSPGAFPRPDGNDVLRAENYPDRVNSRSIGRPVWGFVEYERPLSEEEARRYELTPAPLYKDRTTGELFSYPEMRRRFREVYDGDDDTNPLGPEEYFERVICKAAPPPAASARPLESHVFLRVFEEGGERHVRFLGFFRRARDNPDALELFGYGAAFTAPLPEVLRAGANRYVAAHEADFPLHASREPAGRLPLVERRAARCAVFPDGAAPESVPPGNYVLREPRLNY